MKKRKQLSTGILLLLILLYTFTMLFLGVFNGLLLDRIINHKSDIIIYILFAFLTFIMFIILSLILLRNKDVENNKNRNWFINYILIFFVITLIISAISVFISGPDEGGIINYIVGFLIFPLIGIVSTFNVVKYVKKDVSKWKNIFYSKGNLHKIYNSKDYYKVKRPVDFEKKILHAVYKEQFLNLLVVIGIMLVVIFSCIHYMIIDHSYTDNVIDNLINTRARKTAGFMFFMTIIFLAFGIPIISFYITNAIEKIKVVKKHEYIAFHAIVNGVRNGKLTIFDKKKRYSYNYCTCVGIKEKDISFTPAVLIFIPDDVLLFPDKTN